MRTPGKPAKSLAIVIAARSGCRLLLISVLVTSPGSYRILLGTPTTPLMPCPP